MQCGQNSIFLMHTPTTLNYSDDDDESFDGDENFDENDICSECENHPALSWSPLCFYCDDYFGGLDGLERYNRDLAIERGYY